MSTSFSRPEFTQYDRFSPYHMQQNSLDHDTSRSFSPNMANGGPVKVDSPYSSRLSVQSGLSNPPKHNYNTPLKNAYGNHVSASPRSSSRDDYSYYTPREYYNHGNMASTEPLAYPSNDPAYSSYHNDPPNMAPTSHDNYRPSPTPRDRENEVMINGPSSSSYPRDHFQPGYQPDQPLLDVGSYGNYRDSPHSADLSPHPFPRSELPERFLDAYDSQPEKYSHNPDPYSYDGDTSQDYHNSSLPPIDHDPFRDDIFPHHEQHVPINADISGNPPYLDYGEDPQAYDINNYPATDPHPESPYVQGVVLDENERPYMYASPPEVVYPSDTYPSNYAEDLSFRDDESARWRSPDLQEVIDYLTHRDDDIKANAAAYLTHLSFTDDDMKAKIRAMGGIQGLVGLLGNEYPDVCRNACTALKNLSFGKANADNKLEIRDKGGIPALVRLLRKTVDLDMVELITAILLNLSSLEAIKLSLVEDALSVLVNLIIISYAGWERHSDILSADYTNIRWTTDLRNTTGILRNLSSGSYAARKRLRDCEGLAKCVIHFVRVALDQKLHDTDPHSIDNKCVENCICTMRNLSYLCQEYEDPNFQSKRPTHTNKVKSDSSKASRTGCLGGRKKGSSTFKNSGDNFRIPLQQMKPVPQDVRQLWHSSIVPMYTKLLNECSNTVTLEAIVGAILNVSACHWQQSVDFRETVRREKCLTRLVYLVNVESEPVVCSAISALRYLAVDEQNKALIGKYAIAYLVLKLPVNMSRQLPHDQLVQTTIVTFMDVIYRNSNYVQVALEHNIVERLRFIVDTQHIYLEKTLRLVKEALSRLWTFTELHKTYKMVGFDERTFSVTKFQPRPDNQPMPIMNYLPPAASPRSLQRYDGGSLSQTQLLTPSFKNQSSRTDGMRLEGYVNPAHKMSETESLRQYPSNLNGTRDMSAYRSADSLRSGQLIPASPAPHMQKMGSQQDFSEPLYAQVNKYRGYGNVPDLSHIRLEDNNAVTNADSWV